MFAAIHFDLSVAVLGLIVGTSYGLLAIGLVLVYRSGEVVNFAHGSVGAFAAAAFGVFVTKTHAPYYLAFPLVIALGAGVGVVTELAVIRRLSKAPQVVKLVATIGVAASLTALSAVLLGGQLLQLSADRYPRPPWVPVLDVGSVHIGQTYVAMLLLSPVVVAFLTWFIQRSKHGVAIRGAAANPATSRLCGVSANRMSAISWGLAGALSAYTAVLLYPTLGFGASSSFGPAFLLRALAAAVIARMVSLPVAFCGGLAVGVVEQLIRLNSQSNGPVDAALFVVILAALLVQRRRGGLREKPGSNWLAVEPWAPLSHQERANPLVRYAGVAFALVAGLVAVVLGMTVTSSSAVILTAVMAFAMIGMGVGVISGLAGQLSLGQFAIAGVGSAVSYVIVHNMANFPLALLAAGLAAALISVLLGIPAVRIPGLMFAVASLAFAQAMPWAFQQSWLFGNGKSPGRPIIAGFAFDNSRRYYFFTLAVLALTMLVVRNVWRGGLGRRLRAVRDNEYNARAFTISATRVKLEAFAIAGFITGVGGAIYSHSLASVNGFSFPTDASLTVVAIVAVGGIGLMAGPILGGLYLIALPRFIPLDSAGVAATQLGWLILVLQFPGGVAQGFAPLREAILRLIARESLTEGGVVERSADLDSKVVLEVTSNRSTASGSYPLIATRVPAHAEPTSEILIVEGLSKAYGGLDAVRDVTFAVAKGETLGIIGPNGAGKTTLFEMIGGFVRPDRGQVVFNGSNITTASPERRGRLGLIRSFQDAALFPTLTVTETVELALERTIPTNPALELSGFGRSTQKRKSERASELIGIMGLDAYRDARIIELSTGTRRVAELACLVALEPSLLLLDEPTSGIAQRESEALGKLLMRIKDQLGTTMVVIEHDIPLISSISDRMIAMAAGAVVIIGAPAAVRSHPEVVSAYLGASTTAIERSNQPPISLKSVCTATTRSGRQCTRPAVRDELCNQHLQLAGARA